MPAHYDDPNFSYVNYWQDRGYENHSEIEAIKFLLGNRVFSVATDIGGGYGRLIPTLRKFAKKVILLEPSKKQRKIANELLSHITSLSILPGSAEKTRLPEKSTSLITMIRVMHHLPNPVPVFIELNRILKPGGTLILEFANSKNFKAQIQSFLTGKPILPIPIERRSQTNIKKNTIDFVNHHPNTVIKQLRRSGFVIDRILSVSNLRSPFIKKIIPLNLLLILEKKLQAPLGNIYFGPSIFVLAHKSTTSLDKYKNP